MPPPRRFSAAPTLACPHRNKSSSHSSSSLHHTYSIDSSESMITVIPAHNRPGAAGGNQPDFHLQFKRSSRGSISCLSSQAQSPCYSGQGASFGCLTSHMSPVAGGSGDNLERSGSIYNLQPRSPLSPSRCSPVPPQQQQAEPGRALSPIGHESPVVPHQQAASLVTGVRPASPSSPPPVASLDTAGHAPITAAGQQNQQRTAIWLTQTETGGNRQQQAANLDALASTEPARDQHANLMPVPQLSPGDQLLLDDDSSLVAEIGTSFNSSKNELDELASVSSFGDAASPCCASRASPRVDDLDDSIKVLMQDGRGGDFVKANDRQTTADNNYDNQLGGVQATDTLRLPPVRPHGLQQQQQQQQQQEHHQYHQDSHRGSTFATTYDTCSSIDPNLPMICATINDFCARHSREELLYLVSQIDGLKMSECYYSEKSSTLCMVIEIYNCDSSDIQSANC
jgi:hypothetical protein